ncbi:MAG: phosphohydrolase [Candidatus Cloacimonetes bacterium]|nr:phosphohydrolase [Candidatus Cloacimonadota bacterium]HHD82817.1 phosphohydrolase [Bacteroidota bacterium]
MIKKTRKQIALEKSIFTHLEGKSAEIANFIFNDVEIQTLQDFANTVSIKRLGYNDHGPVHMRTAALNALIMFDLLHNAGIKLNLESEHIGTYEDSKVCVLAAALLHDVGMTATRDHHEIIGIIFAEPIIRRMLDVVYKDNVPKKTILKAMIIEGIFGHMATEKIYSLEAGLVLIGDGCDMEKGRSRITTLLSQQPRVGDIHKYSASSIQKVNILPGEKKPIMILIEMSQSAGFFQIEEVLFPKIISSPVKPYIELYGQVKNKEMMQYL